MKHILTFGLLALCLSCATPTDTQESDQTVFLSDTIRVTSYTSRFEKLSYPVKVIGKIRSDKRSNLIFERSGIIASVQVANGQYVKKGQVIATLKNSQESLEKQSAEVALKRANVEYENEMIALGDSTYYKERWANVKENVQLNTGVLAARLNLKKAELAYQQTIIRAPISGIIEGVNVQPGDFSSTNGKFGSIYDPTAFEVACDVLEYDVLKISNGMKATVTPLAKTEVTLGGRVTEVNPAVNERGLAGVVVQIQDAEKVIPGLSVRVEINITDNPSIVVPMQAVVKRSERHVVFNIENGLAKWNYVTIGKDNGEKVQILDGLSENMEIITSNNLQLAHDSPVRIE